MTRSKGLSDNFAKKRRAARRLRYQQQLLNQDEELPGPSYQKILPHEDNQDNRFTQSDSDSTSDEHDRSNLQNFFMISTNVLVPCRARVNASKN